MLVDKAKNKLILALAIVSATLLIGLIGACNTVFKYKSALDKEMTARFNLEEKVSKSLREKESFEEQIGTIKKQLEEERLAHQATKDASTQEKSVNQNLNEELQKMTKLKETLEGNLKEALATKKPAQPNR